MLGRWIIFSGANHIWIESGGFVSAFTNNWIHGEVILFQSRLAFRCVESITLSANEWKFCGNSATVLVDHRMLLLWAFHIYMCCCFVQRFTLHAAKNGVMASSACCTFLMNFVACLTVIKSSAACSYSRCKPRPFAAGQRLLLIIQIVP